MLPIFSCYDRMPIPVVVCGNNCGFPRLVPVRAPHIRRENAPQYYDFSEYAFEPDIGEKFRRETLEVFELGIRRSREMRSTCGPTAGHSQEPLQILVGDELLRSEGRSLDVLGEDGAEGCVTDDPSSMIV